MAYPHDTPSLAYVTLLGCEGDDVNAVVGLAKSLRKVHSRHRIVVAVLPQVREEQRQILVSQGCIVREIDPVHLPENQTRSPAAYNNINCSAIRIWEFLDYDKMVYLNADVQVHNNIDHLFDYPDGFIFATMKCFCATVYSHGPQYCPHAPDKVQWDTKMGPNPPVEFDAGMFVFEPSSATCHGLIDTLMKNTNVGFEELLNLFCNQTYLPLPFMYNFNPAMILHHPEHELDKVKVVRYCDIESKPWKYKGEQLQQIKELLEKWYEIYNDASLDYDNYVASPE